MKRLAAILLGLACVCGLSNAAGAAPTGWVDAANCSWVSGWSCDSTNFPLGTTVYFYLDSPTGLYLGSVLADQQRPDLPAFCGGTTAHGFSFPTTSVFQDGQSHTVYARAAPLDGSSAFVNLPPASPAAGPFSCSGSPTCVYQSVFPDVSTCWPGNFNSRGSNVTVMRRSDPDPNVYRYDYAPSIMLDGSTYKMWWCGGGDAPVGDHIFYATAQSLDGPWSTPVSVLAPTSQDTFDGDETCDPSVIRINGTYYMYYGGLVYPASRGTEAYRTTNMGVATSPDGITWTRLNNGNPIVRPVRDDPWSYDKPLNYGAGQPDVTYVNGKFYLIYVDTTGKASNPYNGAGTYVLRSSDPTFQTGVEELVGPGNFQPTSAALHTTYAFADQFATNWLYSDQLGAFEVANHSRFGRLEMKFMNSGLSGTVIDSFSVKPYDWTGEGPGLVGTPDRHALADPGLSGRLHVEVMRTNGSPTDLRSWDLAHMGFDVNLPSGFHDGSSCSAVTGWVCDGDDYTQPLTIKFFDQNNNLLGTTVANQPREPGVGVACGGNAAHGFSWTPPADGTTRTIYAYAANIGNPPIPDQRLNGAGSGVSLTCTFQDHPAGGNLDAANGAHIAGWASDPDFNGPIMVHIYVDGQMTQRLLANNARNDVGNHGFDWIHKPFGAGTHDVVVYAIGVNQSGVPTGANVPLSGTPKTFNVGCQGLVENELEWCTNNPSYWTNRQQDARFLQNENVRIGMDSSLGGTITQLYAGDWTNNLIQQHGGSAVQLSLWGNEAKGGNAYFYQNINPGECDPTPYPTQAACTAAHPNQACIMRGDPTGAQVANCTTVKSCDPGQDAGLPFNPIQGQGPNCSWVNPVAPTVSPDLTTYSMTSGQWNNFTKTSSFQGLTIRQDVQLGDAYAQVTYDITYNGPYTTMPTTQEIPAFFTAAGISDHVYYYTGAGYGNVNAPAARTAIGISGETDLLLPGRSPQVAGLSFTPMSEHWWSTCDASDTRCVTVAGFDPLMVYSRVVRPEGANNTAGYAAPFGVFNFFPGAHYHFSMYVFPYKYDAVVTGKSIRQRIFDLHTTYGNAALEYPAITSPLAATAFVGQPFSYQLTASHSPANYAVTAVNLPPGLTFDAVTHTITGTPQTTGVYNTVYLSATNSSGSTWPYQPGTTLTINVTNPSATPPPVEPPLPPVPPTPPVEPPLPPPVEPPLPPVPPAPPDEPPLPPLPPGDQPPALSPPDLSSLNGKTFSLKDEITLPYNGQATGFNWDLSPNGSAAPSFKSLRSSGALVQTAVARLGLSSQNLAPGSYLLKVQAVNGSQTSTWASATIMLSNSTVVSVRVHPNPYRAARGDDSITFDQMPANSTVKIFTVSGRWVKTLSAPSGSVPWNLNNDSGDRVASGIYLYLVTDGQGNKTRGKFTIIK